MPLISEHASALLGAEPATEGWVRDVVHTVAAEHGKPAKRMLRCGYCRQTFSDPHAGRSTWCPHCTDYSDRISVVGARTQLLQRVARAIRQ